MEITLADVLTLEPRLGRQRAADEAVDVVAPLTPIDVSWAVSARTTVPHLPLLRGGELLLVSRRVTAVLDTNLRALAREAAQRGVSAFVFETGDPRCSFDESLLETVPVLYWSGDLAAESETTINRLLTENRGKLYRIGSDLERRLTEVAVDGGGIGALVALASVSSQLPMVVFDSRGRRLAASPDDNPIAGASPPRASDMVVRRDLPSGASLLLGPLDPADRLLARFLADRIAAAANAAIQRDDAARPRGSRRTQATEALLASDQRSAREQRAEALALGFDPDGVFLVAVIRGHAGPDLVRSLGSLGAVHPAGDARGRRASLIAVNGRAGIASLTARIVDLKRRWNVESAGTGATLALSAPSRGAASLPRAAREAQFVATLQARERFPCRAASFDSVDDVGAMGLLYELKDSVELRQFISEAIGPLQQRDGRGTLRATLRAFFESGGSHVDASSRLGIHRNTLAYRLRRVGELLGRDVADPSSWLTLHLALRASEMLEDSPDER